MIRRLKNRIQRRVSKTNTNGFTIVELLIVVAIIAVIVFIIFIILETSQATERDTKRIRQTEEFMKALKFYYNDTAEYPNDRISGTNKQPVPLHTIESELESSGYLLRIPPDPLFEAAKGYLYCSSGAGDSYALLVHMEKTSQTEYCVVSEGPDAYQNTLCNNIASLDKCAVNF